MTAPATQGMIGSSSYVPPVEYWTALGRELPRHPVDQLRRKSDARQNAFRPSDLPPPRARAEELLDRVAADGWIVRRLRRECPDCGYELRQEDVDALTCPSCDASFGAAGDVTQSVVYLRDVTTRQVDWVVAIHGMNTRGEWQEDFSWFFGTTWGRSVPVSVYKYGMVIAGVIMSWRRRALQERLRARIARLRQQAEAQGFSGKPDVIAHSFGTWLLGHVLEAELERPEDDRLRVGRLILAGCILRPDFDWRRLKKQKIVDEVLCHYGTRDSVVPLAHYAIRDSGPSGRRGFDGGEVINLCARDYGHSDLMSIKKCVVGGKHLQGCTGAPGETRHLEHNYRTYWRPFLQLPAAELGGLPDREDPPTPWRPAPRWLQGAVLPIFALPLIVLLPLLAVALGGRLLGAATPLLGLAAGLSGAGLVALLLAILALLGWRRLRGSDRGGPAP